MTYGLLWIEILLACLLCAAMFITLGLRVQSNWRKIAMLVMTLILPLGFPFGVGVGVYYVLHRFSKVYTVNLVLAILLLLGYVGGILIMLRLALRRNERRLRHRATRPISWSLLSLVLTLGLMSLTFRKMSRSVKQELESLSIETQVQISQITTKPVPDSLNAWILYKEADERFNSMPDQEQVGETIFTDEVDAGSSEVTAYLQHRSEVLSLIRRAANMPHCHIGFQAMDFTDEHSSEIARTFRHCTNMLDLAARAEVACGEIDTALTDISCLDTFAQHVIENNPTIIGVLVMGGIQHKANQTLITALPRITNLAQLTSFSLPDDKSIALATTCALRGEELLGMTYIIRLAEGKLDDPELRIFASPLSWMICLKQEFISYRQYMQKIQSLYSLPSPGRFDQIQQLENAEQHFKAGGALTTFFAPAMTSAFRSLARCEASHLAAKVAVAATRYRLDHHGQYPATGQELVPQYLDAWPVDPFDGKPLRYLRHEDGALTIYSVGDDLQDDGGKIDRPDDQHRAPDVGYRLPLPPAR